MVRTKLYVKALKRMGVDAKDIAALELSVASDPAAGDVIRGLKGIRKIRFGFGGRGKRGGGRAVYFAVVGDDVVIMLLAYAKNAKPDLTAEDRRVLLALMEEMSNG
jgi:hypothetical protein